MTLPPIRRAVLADAAALAELAERTFTDAFGAMNRPDDLARHNAESYGEAVQARELADPATTTIVADHQGALVAYAQVRRGDVPDRVTGADPIELVRFYVSREWHGKGLAQELMARVLSTAEEVGARTVWLGVWEQNPRGIAFYRKCGFVDVGSKVYVVGSDPQTDRVMTRPVDR